MWCARSGPRTTCGNLSTCVVYKPTQEWLHLIHISQPRIRHMRPNETLVLYKSCAIRRRPWREPEIYLGSYLVIMMYFFSSFSYLKRFLMVKIHYFVVFIKVHFNGHLRSLNTSVFNKIIYKHFNRPRDIMISEFYR